MDWTEIQRRKVSQMWEEGMSASEIAEKMSVSRNSVLGVIHRMKLTPRENPMPTIVKKMNRLGGNAHGNADQPKVNGIIARQAASKDLPELRSDAWTALPGTQPVPLEQRTGCKWPIGPRSPFLFCNAPAGEKGRYCPHHEEKSRSKT